MLFIFSWFRCFAVVARCFFFAAVVILCVAFFFSPSLRFHPKKTELLLSQKKSVSTNREWKWRNEREREFWGEAHGEPLSWFKVRCDLTRGWATERIEQSSAHIWAALSVEFLSRKKKVKTKTKKWSYDSLADRLSTSRRVSFEPQWNWTTPHGLRLCNTFFSAIIVAPYRETLIFHIFELSRDYRSEFDLSRRRALLLCWKCTKLYERSSDTRKKCI